MTLTWWPEENSDHVCSLDAWWPDDTTFHECGAAELGYELGAHASRTMSGARHCQDTCLPCWRCCCLPYVLADAAMPSVATKQIQELQRSPDSKALSGFAVHGIKWCVGVCRVEYLITLATTLRSASDCSQLLTGRKKFQGSGLRSSRLRFKWVKIGHDRARLPSPATAAAESRAMK